MTQMAQNSSAFAEKVIPRVPMRRWGKPEDFGGIAVYLASDASKYHTGDTFIIDGGYIIFRIGICCSMSGRNDFKIAVLPPRSFAARSSSSAKTQMRETVNERPHRHQ